MANYGVKVEVQYDRCGCLLIDPVCKRRLARCTRERIAAHKDQCPDMHKDYNRKDTEEWLRPQAAIFIQREDGIASALADLGMADSEEADEHGRLSNNLKNLRKSGRANRRSLDSGWTVTTYMDHEMFESMFCCYNNIAY